MMIARGDLVEVLPTTRIRSVKPRDGLLRKWCGTRNQPPNRYNIEIQV
jgi:hypothetical protein